MKTKILSIILAIAMLAGGMAATTQPVSAAFTITNGDFESGDLDGWTIQKSSLGSAVADDLFTEGTGAYTIVPQGANNNYFALLKPYTNGVYTIISQRFDAVAGDWISGLVNFGSEDYLPYDDIGQVRVLDVSGNPVAVPFSATSSIMGGIRKTGWVQWGYKFTSSGTYSIEARVTNVGDNYRGSVIALDQVSDAPLYAPYSLTLPVIPSGSGSVVAKDAAGNVLPAVNGVISNLAAGTPVNLTATASPGYNFTGWAGGVLGTSSTITVTMDSSKTVVASFRPITYNLSWTTSGSGTISATANGVAVASGASIPWGAAISLNAAPANGWNFQGWTGGITSSSPTVATSMSSNLSVVGTFVQANYTLTLTKTGDGTGNVILNNPGPNYHYGDSVQLTASPDTGSYFAGWGGALSGNTTPASIYIYGNYSISAEFNAIPLSQYIINVSANGQGSVIISNSDEEIVPNGSTIEQGSVLTLTPVPSTGWDFSAWDGDATGTSTPYTVTMDSNKTISAVFTKITYSITVNYSGTGAGNVTLIPSGTYHYGDVVQLTAQPDGNSIFSGWGGALSGTASPTSLTISDNTIVSASFSPKPVNQVTLTVIVKGNGSVTRNPDQASYPYDPSQGANLVTLTATPSQGYTFSGWSGDASGSTPSVGVVMDANKTVTATFVQNTTNSFTVAVTSSGNGTAGISQNGTLVSSGTYLAGTQITLVATPNTGYKFTTWSGTLSGTSSPLTITVNANMNITAGFTILTFTMTTFNSGSGTVTGNLAPVYSYGETVTLTATPAPGWTFSNWSGDASGNANPVAIVMYSNKSITAIFNQVNPNPYTLTVNTVGNGTVTVTPNSPSYAMEALVSLLAVPAAGSVFTNWTGNASGTVNPIIVTVTGNLTVTANFAAITLVSNTNPSVYGQAVSLSAAVATDSSVGVAATGTFQLVVDGSSSGSPVTLNNGSAALTLNALTVGTHTLSVSYSGDSRYSAGTSPSVNQIVNKANTSTTINATNSGLNFIFTAAVSPLSPGAGVISGNVVFMNGTTVLGTQPVVSGQAVLNVTLASGGITVTAQYGGDTNFNSSSAFLITPAVKIASTLALTAVPNPSSFGSLVTFTASVSGAGAIPSGSLVFTDGGTTLATITLDAAGKAVLTTSALSVGTHAVAAQYGGDTLYNGSQASLNQVVTVNSAITLSVDINPSVFGEQITFTAVTTGVASGQSLNFKDGSGDLGSAVVDATGKALYSASNLSVGTHNISAVYSQVTSNVIAQLVNKADTAVQLSGTPGNGGYLFEVDVTALTPGNGIPSGTVTFLDGINSLGNAVQLSASGHASLTAVLAAGVHTITAQYNGNASFNTSLSQPVVETIKAGSIQLASSLNPSILGDSVTFTASVTGSAVAATGSVIFKDASTTLATVNLSAAGVAVYTTSALLAGSHPITVQYAGDANYNAVTASLNQVVNKIGTTTTVTSSLNPSIIGQSVTFTAQVSDASAAANPSGSVTFFDDTTSLGTATLDASGKAVLAVSNLIEGTHEISVVYAGDTNFNTSTSADLIQTVNNSCTRNYLLHVSACGGTVTISPRQCSFAPGTIVTLTAVAKPGYTFVGWEGALTGNDNPATLVMNSDKLVKAIFNESHPSTGYTLTTSVIGQGSISVNPAQATYTKYTKVALTAVPAEGYRFYKWQGDLCGDDNTETISMTENKQVTAVFKAVCPTSGYTLTTAVSVPGQGTITVNPLKATYDKYDNVTLTAVPAAGYTFDKWQGDLYGDDNPESIRMTENKQVTAVFKATTSSGYTLSTTVVGSGSITKDPNQATYAKYTNVNLTAVPAAGYTFDKWQGDLEGCDSTESIRMTENKAVTAVFKLATTSGYTLSTTVVGSGSITRDPNQATYAKYTNVNLTAVPAAGYTFDKWQGDLYGCDSTESIRMTENKEVTAVFKAVPVSYKLTLSYDSHKGDVEANPDADRYDKYPAGTLVTLSADPHSGYSVSWSGVDSSNGNTATVTMNGNETVTVTFNQCASTRTTLTSSSNPANLGVNVIFTATVSNANSPSGSVTFKDESNILGTGLVSNGKATYTTNVLAAGSHSITAVYSGDSRNSSSTSAALTQVINKVKINTTTTLTVPTGPAAVGKAIITAKVQPVSGSGTPTGTVSFYNGSSKLGDAALSGSLATLNSSNLPSGSYTIKATYNGDSSYNTSSSAVATAFILYQSGQFVIWGNNPGGIHTGDSCNFWGSQWEKQVKSGNYPGNASFKGFANLVDDSHNTWSTDPGNSCQPPSSIGSYISVIVSKSITKNGSNLRGDISQVVLVRVDDPSSYQSNPGHSCNGTVVGIIR